MSDVEETKRRRLVFRVHDEDTNEIITREAFESAASNADISAYVHSSIERLAEIRAFFQSAPAARQQLFETQTVTLYIRERESDAARVVLTLRVGERQRELLEDICTTMVANVEAALASNVNAIYRGMVAKIERDGLDVWTMTDAQWREVCLLHPLYLYQWNMEQKIEFEERSRESILSGLRKGTYKLQGFVPKRASGVAKKKN